MGGLLALAWHEPWDDSISRKKEEKIGWKKKIENFCHNFFLRFSDLDKGDEKKIGPTKGNLDSIL